MAAQESERKKGRMQRAVERAAGTNGLADGAISDAIPDAAGGEDGHRAAKPNSVPQQVNL